MTSTESIRLVRRLIAASWDHCHATRTTTDLEAATAEERRAASDVLEGLLGRVPTAEELEEVLGIGGEQ